MPVYEFFCECGKREDMYCPVERRDNQVCDVCGGIMRRKLSILSQPIIRQTGNEMALASLNSKHGGFPNDRYKADSVRGTVAGLTPHKTKYIGRGCDFKN
jgi:hypothetical protein